MDTGPAFPGGKVAGDVKKTIPLHLLPLRYFRNISYLFIV